LKAVPRSESRIAVEPKTGHDSLDFVGDSVGVGLTLVLSFFKPFRFGFDKRKFKFKDFEAQFKTLLNDGDCLYTKFYNKLKLGFC
jgi:hypothetical protein